MKSNLGLKLQGVKGENTTWRPNVGYVAAHIDNNDGNYIAVDAFTGQGDSYKRSEQCEITVCKGRTPIFVGTFEELCAKLV